MFVMAHGALLLVTLLFYVIIKKATLPLFKTKCNVDNTETVTSGRHTQIR